MNRTVVTKEKLQEYGIIDISWNGFTNSWDITRLWRKNNSSVKIMKKLKIRTVHNNPKYAPRSYYQAISFSYGKQKITLTLQRVVYAWFIGPVTLEYDVDHINNNKLDNRLENLRLLTHYENMQQRLLKINHHYYIDTKEEKING